MLDRVEMRIVHVSRKVAIPQPKAMPLTDFTFWAGAGFAKSWDPDAPVCSSLFLIKLDAKSSADMQWRIVDSSPSRAIYLEDSSGPLWVISAGQPALTVSPLYVNTYRRC
jgi:hypothetical protein